MTESAGGAPDIDALVARLQERVAERRASGDYPPGLEDQLDEHFRNIVHHRAARYDFKELYKRLADLDEAMQFNRGRIPVESKVPGGSALHTTVAKLVSRQTQGILEQVQEFADQVRGVMWELVRAVEDPAAHKHPELQKPIDTALDRIAAIERTPSDPAMASAELRRRVEILEEAEDRRHFDPWWSNENFEEEFRGKGDELLERYRDLAARFGGCDPVIDVGCGRGEFISLLKDAGVEAFGIEIDPGLVHDGKQRGIPIELGDAVSYLRSAEDDSLGGVAMIQVVEHLTPQELVEAVALMAHKIRPGGQVIIETVNPQSLYVFAHSFFLDPSHVAPVHPAYLHFLLREAGFKNVEIEWRSPCPPQDVLEAPEGDDIARRNVERLNTLLFAAQDYAVIARR